ncbi:MAG: DUF1365 domain-containing protein [Pseudomonadales bacterium]|nr:DUF1365 domain-containing protein [Pseudomonadales bacterium]
MIWQAVATGRVWHQRHAPFRHGFSYPLWLIWCDLDDIASLLQQHRWWGRRWRPVVFRDSDFVDSRPSSLADKVRGKASEQGLDWSGGRVVMLGQWRTFGTLFNPLVLYLHFADGEDAPDSMLAEVRNTPWNQRHFYALQLRAQTDGNMTASHAKTFHVSPFLPMDLDYHWRLHVAFPELRLVLEDRKANQPVFTAGMSLTLQAPQPQTLCQLVFRFGAQGLATLRRIYWQAFRLWRKGAKFHGHPDKQAQDQ